jgi:DNA-binding MarR family transcriptional regulator
MCDGDLSTDLNECLCLLPKAVFVKEIKRLLKILELVRSKVHRELPLQQLVLFLTVAENPGITMPELVVELDMPQGTVSRNVKALSHYVLWQDGVAVPHGRNLLRTQANEENRHELAVFTTGRGEALVGEITRHLSDNDEDESGAGSSYRLSGAGVLDGYRHWPRH